MPAAPSPKIIGSNPEFTLPLMRVAGWLWNAMVPVLIWLSWSVDDRQYVWLMLAAGYGWALFCWPRTIRFGNEALEQRNMFGKLTRIPYADIFSLVHETESDGRFTTTKVVVNGPDTEIVHTYAHADRAGFIAAVEQRTGKKLHQF